MNSYYLAYIAIFTCVCWFCTGFMASHPTPPGEFPWECVTASIATLLTMVLYLTAIGIIPL